MFSRRLMRQGCRRCGARARTIVITDRKPYADAAGLPTMRRYREKGGSRGEEGTAPMRGRAAGSLEEETAIGEAVTPRKSGRARAGQMASPPPVPIIGGPERSVCRNARRARRSSAGSARRPAETAQGVCADKCGVGCDPARACDEADAGGAYPNAVQRSRISINRRVVIPLWIYPKGAEGGTFPAGILPQDLACASRSPHSRTAWARNSPR